MEAAEELARPAPLIVAESINVRGVAKLAMERAPDEISDPVVVTDSAGRLVGSVTIRHLLMRSTALAAQGSSPLTGLPGNRSIERWILDALTQEDACVVYADLDRFKEYNDCYGFLRGDEMIRCLARVMSGALWRHCVPRRTWARSCRCSNPPTSSAVPSARPTVAARRCRCRSSQ